MSCERQWDERLLDAAYGDLEAAQEQRLQEHLKSCPACQAHLDELTETRALVRAAMPEKSPAQNTWAAVLDRLEPKRSRWSPSLIAAMAAMLLVGIGLGRFSSPAAPESADAVAATQPASELTMEYARFLDRATPVLLAVANRNADGATVNLVGIDALAERKAASELAHSAQQLGQRLLEAGMNREARLTDSLTIVFMQMANLSRHDYPGGLDVVQTTIESQALLFQLSVEEIRRSAI